MGAGRSSIKGPGRLWRGSRSETENDVPAQEKKKKQRTKARGPTGNANAGDAPIGGPTGGRTG